MLPRCRDQKYVIGRWRKRYTPSEHTEAAREVLGTIGLDQAKY
jgi:hypothetical protein